MPRSFVTTVPTAAQRTGDFSQTYVRAPSGQPVPVIVYDPDTTRPGTGTSLVRDAFPGNLIPTSRISDVALRLLDLYPLPNAAGDPVINANNFRIAYKDPVRDDGIVAKIDHRFREKHQTFLRLSWRNFQVRRSGELRSVATGDGEHRDSPGVALDDTILLGPSAVLSIRHGFSRRSLTLAGDSLGTDLTTFGFPESLNQSVPVRGSPEIRIPCFVTPGAKTLYAHNAEETHSLRGSLVKQTGRHTLKFGAETRAIRGYPGSPGDAGLYTFSQTFTRGPNPQVATVSGGHALASFLLGYGASGSVTVSPRLAQNAPYCGLFVQEDVRLLKRLSLNLGLRYEWEGAHTERFDRFNRGSTSRP